MSAVSSHQPWNWKTPPYQAVSGLSAIYGNERNAVSEHDCGIEANTELRVVTERPL